MRVSDKSISNLVKRNLLNNRQKVSDFQTKAATQKRVTKPSDDPISSVRILGSRIEEKVSDQFIKNGDFAKSFLEFTDQSLSELNDVLVRAKELILGQVNDASANPTTRRITAAEMQQILWQSIQIGNRKLGDRYIFSGHETTMKPFEEDGRYLGDRGNIKVQVNKDTYIAMNIPGSQVFLGEDLADDGVSRARLNTPKDVEQLREFKQKTVSEDQEKTFLSQVSFEDPQGRRRPAAQQVDTDKISEAWRTGGTNLFNVLRSVHTGLIANDKASLQDSLPKIDQAIAQVVLARSELGSRAMALKGELETLSKAKIDSKALTSAYEDVDTFKVVTDLKGAQNVLETTLKTSGDLIQPSLLDFIR